MLEDPLLLARLQFALTAGTHYMFVALTLGLAPFILFGQLRATLARDEARMRAVRFWGGLYLVNYGMGILSGLVMELQLATNWAGLNDMFGYAFSAPLAVETMAAFFVESTFLGLWIFGWDRMGRWSHLACFLVVTATAYASAYWVLVANGFLKNPVGFEIRDGEAVLTDSGALLTNPSTLLAFGHATTGALLLGGLVVAAVSAYHLARGHDPDGMFRRGITSGLTVTAAAVMPVVAFGGTQYALFGNEPPTSGRSLSATEIARVEEDYGGGAAHAVGEVGHVLMTLCWTAIAGVAAAGLVLWLVNRLHRWRWFHWMLVFSPFLPYIASLGGWAFRETGRQPWTVTHHLTTADAMTEMSPAMAVLSFSLFTVAFAVLAAVTYWLLVRFARRGPEGGPLAPRPEEPDSDPQLPVHRF
ncbi:cytochrome ubiquinol oxidase subunit I [Halostreptopolyspora alba]|uniref:Cytochrome ubiquinol oxidase subunit I n=1 Tax=Halostreptopolyspora alba TaxID=2487137 RepID=A0A3N0DYT6_9ACTN|nr:cytochrome ubiquinol oxidase subunit I [Nocardiopsaceae bacterium YIM 96095]